MIVKNILNLSENRLRLKEKQTEIESYNLKKLSIELNSIKQNPRLYVEQTY